MHQIDQISGGFCKYHFLQFIYVENLKIFAIYICIILCALNPTIEKIDYILPFPVSRIK